jgi:hypothetical protein
MGTYYRFDNHDKKESIDPYAVENIKYGCMTSWSLQHAILTVFLGFNFYRSNIDLGEWVGRWSLDRIRIHNDGEDDSESDTWPDVSMKFLTYLDEHGMLEKWLRGAGLRESIAVDYHEAIRGRDNDK